MNLDTGPGDVVMGLLSAVLDLFIFENSTN